MNEKTIMVTQRGQATIPKEFRDKFGIHAPGRVTMEATEEGVIIKPVPTPEELTGDMRGMTDDEGRTGVELLRDTRRKDAEAERRPQNE